MHGGHMHPPCTSEVYQMLLKWHFQFIGAPLPMDFINLGNQCLLGILEQTSTLDNRDGEAFLFERSNLNLWFWGLKVCFFLLLVFWFRHVIVRGNDKVKLSLKATFVSFLFTHVWRGCRVLDAHDWVWLTCHVLGRKSDQISRDTKALLFTVC